MVRENWVQSSVESYQRFKTWYIMPPRLTLIILRYESRISVAIQSGPRTNGNEGVLRIPQSSRITKASPSDYLVSYSRHSFGGSFTSLQRCSQCILQPQQNKPCKWSMEFAYCIPLQRSKIPRKKKEYPVYDYKQHLITRLQFSRSGKYGVSFIAIIPSSTLTQSGSTYLVPIYGLNRYV